MNFTKEPLPEQPPVERRPKARAASSHATSRRTCAAPHKSLAAMRSWARIGA
jgi:hypothetical protein